MPNTKELTGSPQASIKDRITQGESFAALYKEHPTMKDACDAAYRTISNINSNCEAFECMWLAINSYAINFGGFKGKSLGTDKDLSHIIPVAYAMALHYYRADLMIYATHAVTDEFKGSEFKTTYLVEMWSAIDEFRLQSPFFR